MSNLQKMNSNPNPSFISYLGAVLVGFMLQAVFQLTMSNLVVQASLLILTYALLIAIITFYGIKFDNKYLLEFNEFWITLDEFVKNKIHELTFYTNNENSNVVDKK